MEDHPSVFDKNLLYFKPDQWRYRKSDNFGQCVGLGVKCLAKIASIEMSMSILINDFSSMEIHIIVNDVDARAF
jgi:hypothetical protein